MHVLKDKLIDKVNNINTIKVYWHKLANPSGVMAAGSELVGLWEIGRETVHVLKSKGDTF